ncbi:MAG: hypothetical protein KF901_01815 [Myxococcales bacterium]|nr:hypothetical protein [Myxococcales bacterium]
MRAAFLASLLLFGCYLHRDTGPDAAIDGGPTPDAPWPIDAGPGCEPIRVVSSALACPSQATVGEPVTVQVTATHGGCCRGGELIPRVTSPTPFTRSIALDGYVCECCAECLCLGPILERDVTLHDLPVGRTTVRAGDASCVIEVVDAGECAPMGVDDLRMPRVLFPRSTFGFTGRSNTSGCSCNPRLTSGPLGYAAELCDCCELCDCIDPPYEVSYFGAPPGGALVLDGARYDIDRRSADSCPPVEARLELVPPDESVLRDGPAIWWLRLRGESPYADCCGPSAGVDVTSSGANEWRVQLRDCTPPCRCAGPPAQLDAWMPLGPLAPGGYLVRYGASELSFMVPR